MNVDEFLEHHGVKGMMRAVNKPKTLNRIYRVAAATETKSKMQTGLEGSDNSNSNQMPPIHKMKKGEMSAKTMLRRVGTVLINDLSK